VATFSDYIVYADESGSPTLDGVDPTFPVFVLAMILVRKDTYVTDIVPSVQRLKFDSVGHDQLILHERDIRRQKDEFAFLQVSQQARMTFLAGIDQIVSNSEFTVYAAVIDKNALKAKYATPWSPYEIALLFLMERLLRQLVILGQAGTQIHVVFECRGHKEDTELELEFRRIAANQGNWGYRTLNFKQLEWEPKFVDKRSNCSGLQLADLVARPLGLQAIRPTQQNHALNVIRPKLAPLGLKQFP